ncbi:Rap guanine nucleotide exchange factor 2 [Podochytrium sp. JEL0797]|nr:Rap guanine nucleotide exchange factor 2 [Podochytrium sp. JEL0797]
MEANVTATSLLESTPWVLPEIVRVDTPITGTTLQIKTNELQSFQDILFESCAQLSLVPSKYKIKVTFKSKRVAYPELEDLLVDSRHFEFLSLALRGVERDKLRNVAVLAQSHYSLLVPAKYKTHSVTSTDTDTSTTSAPPTGTTPTPRDSEITRDSNTVGIQIDLPSTPTSGEHSREASHSTNGETGVSDASSVSKDTSPISPLRVSLNSKGSSQKSVTGDTLKPLIPMNFARKDQFRENKRESITNVSVWSLTVAQATEQSKSPPSGIGFLIITLPNYKSIAIRALSTLAMDDILAHVCTKNDLDFDSHTFQTNSGAQNSVVEMDRLFEFFVTKEGLAEMFVVPGDKKYRMNVVRENGVDVMTLQLINGRLQVMSGTPEKIVETLTNPDQMSTDETYLETFMLTFRSFITTESLFENLLGRFFCVLPEHPTADETDYFNRTKDTVRVKTLQTLIWWVENQFHDFTLSTDLRNQLDDFVDELKYQENAHLKEFGTRLMELLNLQTLKYEEMQDYYRIVARRGKTMESMLMKTNPEELAQQLCLHNFKLFRNIHAIEFLNQIWIGKKEDTPYLNFFIERFDKESYWVATEIVKEPNLKKRILILKQFILATSASVKYNNFFSLFSFVSGLNLSPVSRLKKTWAGLPEPVKKVYAEIEKLADPSRNMKNYRDLLGHAAPPIVPFLPIYLKDLTFMNDGNPKLVDGLINFDKLRMMGSRVKDIVSLAEVDFAFPVKPAIQNFIAMPPVETSLAKLKEMSLICEKQVKS